MQLEKQLKITASVVLYKTDEANIRRVIESFKPKIGERKLYFIDNSPNHNPDLSRLPSIEYVHIGKNIGYGKAHNFAIRKAQHEGSDYHVILNPDVEFPPCILDELVGYAETHDDVINIMPKIIYPNGNLQYLCKKVPTPFILFGRYYFLNSRYFAALNMRFELRDSGYAAIMNPPILSGCFMFLRTSAINKYALFFDERFFLYYEDFDLNRRCHRHGRTVYYPNATVVHDHARAAHKSLRMLMVFIQSTVKYFNKYGWIFDSERDQFNQEIDAEIKEIRRCTSV